MDTNVLEKKKKQRNKGIDTINKFKVSCLNQFSIEDLNVALRQKSEDKMILELLVFLDKHRYLLKK